jgi:tRNA (guanine37-N1)-methyltransferase
MKKIGDFMKFDIITIFPKLFESFLAEALIARAQKKGIAKVNVHNLRRWTHDNHKTVDDRPYGGGAGMVLMVEPVLKAVKVLRRIKVKKSRVILFSAKGKKFDQATARRWAELDQLVMICGRYEGVDERVAEFMADEEVSIGDYVLFGGEVPAMAVMEAVIRLLPGAVGKQRSIEDESFKKLSGLEKKLMQQFVEYPHYTRPEVIKIGGKVRRVPKVLLSGDHKRVEDWRKRQSEKFSRKKR